MMHTVTLSQKYQIDIPKEVCKSLRLRLGQKFQVVEYGERIELIPEDSIEELRGFAKGTSTQFVRKEGRL